MLLHPTPTVILLSFYFAPGVICHNEISNLAQVVTTYKGPLRRFHSSGGLESFHFGMLQFPLHFI